jgi:hypothetical protein
VGSSEFSPKWLLLIPIGIFVRFLIRRFAHGFLCFAHGVLSLAFDLLDGVAFYRANHIVGLAFRLFHFSGNYVFLCHAKSPLNDQFECGKYCAETIKHRHFSRNSLAETAATTTRHRNSGKRSKRLRRAPNRVYDFSTMRGAGRIALIFLGLACLGARSRGETTAIVFDPAGSSFDELYAVDAMQGIANRDGPLCFLIRYPFDRQWIDIYTKRNGMRFKEIAGLSTYLKTFGSKIKGLVVYDPTIDGSRCVAMTLAGLDDLLPVDPEMLDGQSSGLKASGQTVRQVLDVPIVYDFRGKFHNSLEAYDWALKNVMPRCNRKIAHTPSGPDVDGVHVGMGPFRGFDWVVGQRGFVFNLSLIYKDMNSFGHRVQGNKEQADMYRRILAALDRPALIYGYGEFEWEWFTLLGSYGDYYLHWGDNVSFHEKVPFSGTLAQKYKPAKADVRVDPDKYYVCFITSEGDTMKGPEPFYYQSWFDSARGKVPMNWTLPPLMARFPAMLSYYYDTATPDDCFIAFDIVNLAHMPELEAFSKLRASELADADLDCVALSSRATGSEGLKTYVAGVEPLGVAVIQWEKPRSPANQEFIGEVPVVTSADKMGYWENKIYGWNKNWAAICAEPSGREQTVTKVIANISAVAEPHPRPFVILIYTEIQGYAQLCELHREIAERLDPKIYKVTRLDEAMIALREWHAARSTSAESPIR